MMARVRSEGDLRPSSPGVRAYLRLMAVHIGTSGWAYPHWRGAFYPKGLPVARELAYMGERFSSIEINRSFYSLLTPASCRAWYQQTPRGFVFALKGSRFITHNKRLRDVSGALANFFASGPLALADKLGPIVWQLPQTLAFDATRMDEFMARLPRNTDEAAELAAQHDHRVKHGACTTFEGPRRRIRHAFEPRHQSFLCPEFALLARKHAVAIVTADSAGWPLFEELTTSFAYFRLHGGEQTYASSYSKQALLRWAQRIEGVGQGKLAADAARISGRGVTQRKAHDVYVYFDNDGSAHAPHNALQLQEALDAKHKVHARSA